MDGKGRWVELGSITYQQMVAYRSHGDQSYDQVVQRFRGRLVERLAPLLGGDVTLRTWTTSRRLDYEVWVPADVDAASIEQLRLSDG